MISLTRYDKHRISNQKVGFAAAANDLLSTFIAARFGQITAGGSTLSSLSITVSDLGYTLREYDPTYNEGRSDYEQLWRLARVTRVFDHWCADPFRSPGVVLARLSTKDMVWIPDQPPSTSIEVALYAVTWLSGGQEIPEMPELRDTDKNTAAAALGLAVEKQFADGIPFRETIGELL